MRNGELTERTAFLRLGGFLAGALILMAAFVYVVDPFYHYHDAWMGLPVVMDNAVYQTSGAARNFEYDSVIIGTSMTENFHAKWFDEMFGWKTLKLSYSGARSDDLKAIFGQVFSRENTPENVVMDINAYQLTVDPFSAYAERPEYLYDRNVFNDVSYLYNQDVLKASVSRVIDKAQGREILLDDAYTWEEQSLFGKEKTLEAEKQSRTGLEESIRAGLTLPTIAVCDENLNNFLPYIEAHPETQFYIFYPPYSMLYWEQEMLKGEVEEMMVVYRHSIERLMKYDNVKIYYFHDEYQVIGDLDNYRDATHYRPEYNRYICECIAQDRNRLTPENYMQRLQDLKAYVLDFDYGSLWKETAVAGAGEVW